MPARVSRKQKARMADAKYTNSNKSDTHSVHAPISMGEIRTVLTRRSADQVRENLTAKAALGNVKKQKKGIEVQSILALEARLETAWSDVRNWLGGLETGLSRDLTGLLLEGSEAEQEGRHVASELVVAGQILLHRVSVHGAVANIKALLAETGPLKRDEIRLELAARGRSITYSGVNTALQVGWDSGWIFRRKAEKTGKTGRQYTLYMNGPETIYELVKACGAGGLSWGGLIRRLAEERISCNPEPVLSPGGTPLGVIDRALIQLEDQGRVHRRHRKAESRFVADKGD